VFFYGKKRYSWAVDCIVTAGPTYEPLDHVRRLTNFSTGRLGSELAVYLAAQGYSVHLLLGEQATCLRDIKVARVETFTTTSDLALRLQKLAAPGVKAVFHAAAVSDFTFGKVFQRTVDGVLTELKSGKYSTRQEGLLAELTPTPKIIAKLREWFPAAHLVGWKYEVEGDLAAVLEKARQQIAECHTNACVANGPAYGIGFGLVTPQGQPEHFRDTGLLFRSLQQLIPSSAR
jgi:phosphopantothenoylcysteine decarboxylase/phosphopantothenate--cysteine ligase